MAVTIEPLTGAALQAALPDLARLRIAVFRAWPYLYDGTLDYEQNYIAKFAAAPRALVVVARDGSRVIGAATAAPIDGHMEAFSLPLLRAGFKTATIFYFGESVLLPEYRGQGIGHAFFDQREAHARQYPEYRMTAFCAVIRPEDHPAKAPDYRSLDDFWMKRGYASLRDRHSRLSWKDIGDEAETEKLMRYWVRPL